MRIGNIVKVLGFAVANSSDPRNVELERGHINRYSGKDGKIVLIDADELHPIHVGFERGILPEVCRFAESEIKAA